MITILKFILAHGYSILFVALFARQIGLPVPGLPLLLAAGALAAAGRLDVIPTVAVAIAACVLADWVWYQAGRSRGDKVLHFLHRFTRDPDFHDRRAKRIFARYGLPVLLVAKFIPGLDAVSPPLAGVSRTSLLQFLAFDAAGAALYVCAYGGFGYFFREDLDRAAAYAVHAGTILLAVAIFGIGIFIAYTLIQRIRKLAVSQVVRIAPAADCAEPVDMPCSMIGEPRDDK